MKTLVTTVIFMICTLSAFAQVDPNFGSGCPGIAWCHPGGIPPYPAKGDLANEAEAASAIGKANQEMSCGENASEARCAVAKWLGGLIACSYGESTPQYQKNCPDAQSENYEPKNEYSTWWYFTIDHKFQPRIIDGKKALSEIQGALDNMKRGEVISKDKSGLMTTLGYKFLDRGSRTDYGAVINVTDKRRNTVAQYLLKTYNGRAYIFKLAKRKSKKDSRKSRSKKQ